MMNKLFLAALVAVSVAACTTDDTSSTVTETAGSPQAIDTLAADVQGASTDGADSADETCNLQTTDAPDTACAHLCDPDFGEKFIPAHVCVTFVCHLTSGDEYLAGGCNL